MLSKAEHPIYLDIVPLGILMNAGYVITGKWLLNQEISGGRVLPDSIPESLWSEFRKMRKKIKAPMTEHAEDIILAKLERWRVEFGANPIDILNESIEKSWRGVFLNGHGAARSVSTIPMVGAQPSASAPPICCSCGGSLDSGFIHTSKGRKCHNC